MPPRYSTLAIMLLATAGVLACAPEPNGIILAGDEPPGGDARDAFAAFPDDAHLVWASDRLDNRHEVFMRRGLHGEAIRLTTDGGRGPRWSPDGRWIAYQHIADHTVRIMRPTGADQRVLCRGISATDGPAYFWRLTDGRLFCAVSTVPSIAGRELDFITVDPDSGDVRAIAPQSDFIHIASIRFDPGALTHDGEALIGWTHGLFEGGYEATNGIFDSYHSTVLLPFDALGEIYHVGSGCSSAAPPAGPWIYHVSRETGTVPDIARVRRDDLLERTSYDVEVGRPDAAWGHEYMPTISNDGVWMVYGASLGCHPWYACDYEIFAHPLGEPADVSVRLTEHPGNDSFPSLFVGEPGGA